VIRPRQDGPASAAAVAVSTPTRIRFLPGSVTVWSSAWLQA